MMATKIVIEKVVNGFIFSIENSGYRAIAKDKNGVGELFTEIIANSLNPIDENNRAVFEIEAKIEKVNNKNIN